MVITQQTTNTEVERIMNYDQVGTILYDLKSKNAE